MCETRQKYGRGTLWSSEEERKLRWFAEKTDLSAAQIGKRMDRSHKAIELKAYKLGVSLGPERRFRHDKEESWMDEILRREYALGTPMKQVLVLLEAEIGSPVTRNSVTGRAARLGLRRSARRAGQEPLPPARVELPSGACPWVVSFSPLVYCSSPYDPGQIFCPEHRARALVPVQETDDYEDLETCDA